MHEIMGNLPTKPTCDASKKPAENGGSIRHVCLCKPYATTDTPDCFWVPASCAAGGATGTTTTSTRTTAGTASFPPATGSPTDVFATKVWYRRSMGPSQACDSFRLSLPTTATSKDGKFSSGGGASKDCVVTAATDDTFTASCPSAAAAHKTVELKYSLGSDCAGGDSCSLAFATPHVAGGKVLSVQLFSTRAQGCPPLSSSSP